MPERLPDAIDELLSEMRELKSLVRGERRWRRVLAVVVVAVALLGVWTWQQRVRSDREDRADTRARCEQTNQSRLAIRDSFHTDHVTLEGLVGEFVDPGSTDGNRFLERLQTVHRAQEKQLARNLPVVACS